MKDMPYSICVVDDGRHNIANIQFKIRDAEFSRKDDFPFVYHNYKKNFNVKKCLYFGEISTVGL